MWAIAFIVGYILCFRKVAGHVLHSNVNKYQPKPDGADIAFALYGALMASFFWPIILICRVCYVLWRKYGNTEDSLTLKLFPALKPVESKAEKMKRIQREKENRIVEQRRAINTRERELGLELTRW